VYGNVVGRQPKNTGTAGALPNHTLLILAHAKHADSRSAFTPHPDAIRAAALTENPPAVLTFAVHAVPRASTHYSWTSTTLA
jgi:hypothetical protein